MFSFGTIARRLGLAQSSTTEDGATARAEKRAAARVEADELVQQLRQETEAKRIRERREQSAREIREACERDGVWFPSDHATWRGRQW
jgi:hypothetical protein